MRFLAPSLALAALASGCTVAANRVALVPHATPLAGGGQPMESVAGLDLGASNAGDVVKPSRGNPDAGLEIPGTQLRGALAFRLARNLSMSLSYERGLHAGAHPLTSTQPPVDGGDAEGYGAGFAYSIETSTPGLRVGLATALTVWNVPYTEYRSCVSGCEIGGIPVTYTDIVRGSDQAATLAVGLEPSYRSGAVTWFGGLTAVNHPTLVQKGVESSLDVGGKVEDGPLNVVAHAGVELALGAGVRARAYVDQTLTRDPVAYGPGIGVMIAIPLGRDEPAAATAPY